MIPSRRFACGVLAFWTSLATPAFAGIPKLNITAPRWISLVGTQNAPGNPLPDPTGAFQVVVHDFANQPVPGAYVVVELTDCSDAHLCQAVVSGQTVICSGKVVTGITDLNGIVSFTILGASDNPGTYVPPDAAPGAGLDCARFIVDGVIAGRATVAVYDQNGFLGPGSGVNGGDMGILKNDVGAAVLAGVYRGRSDYTANGVVNGADIGFFRDVLGRSGQGVGSATGCAGPGGPAAFCP